MSLTLTLFLNQMFQQINQPEDCSTTKMTKVNQAEITIVVDNARGHHIFVDDETERDFDDQSSCPSLSGHSACCAETDQRECDLEPDQDLRESHDHTAASMCRWDSCPHSNCCPRLPCRATEDTPDASLEDHVHVDTSLKPAPIQSHKHQHHSPITPTQQILNHVLSR
jgi:hypothetical protein